MKKIIFIIMCIFVFTFIYADEDNQQSNNSEVDRKKDIKNYKLTKYDIYKIAFWSTYGATGLTGFINSFAQFGYAYYLSQDMNALYNELKDKGYDVIKLYNISLYYPLIIFGSHFLASGLTGIPLAGGIVYGSSLLITGIAFSVLKLTTVYPFNIYATEGKDRLLQLYEKVFDPTSYYVVGSISVLMGIGEIITTMFYLNEKNIKRYPYMQKPFTFNIGPNSFCFTYKLDI